MPRHRLLRKTRRHRRQRTGGKSKNAKPTRRTWIEYAQKYPKTSAAAFAGTLIGSSMIYDAFQKEPHAPGIFEPKPNEQLNRQDIRNHTNNVKEIYKKQNSWFWR
jgi:hypothetical protein